MKAIQHDAMWFISIAIVTVMSYFYEYNVLILFGSVLILRGFVQIMIIFLKRSNDALREDSAQ